MSVFHRCKRSHSGGDGANERTGNHPYFNLAVHPVSGAVYASNTEAQNHIRLRGRALRSVGAQAHRGKPLSVVDLVANRWTR